MKSWLELRVAEDSERGCPSKQPRCSVSHTPAAWGFVRIQRGSVKARMEFLMATRADGDLVGLGRLALNPY